MTDTQVQRAPEDFTHILEVWADTFSVSVNDWAGVLDVGKRAVKAGDPSVYEYRVRMPLPQLKAMALMAIRLIRNYESQAGVTISLPPKLLEALGIPPEDWQGGLT